MIESFEQAMAFAREVVADCDIPLLDRLQRAHDHEIEQLRRLRFREGYVAGQRSMDAEHYAVALRLKHLPLDEDSHGNLSQIARAVWHSDFGWTKGACEALRDELIRLLGGVHDEPVQTAASGCACDADCDCGHGDEPLPNFSEPNLPKSAEAAKPENACGGEVTITDELRKWASDNTIKNMVLTTYPEQHGVHGILEQLIAIADRIDAAVKHERERDQLRIEKLVQQRDELKESLEATDTESADIARYYRELKRMLGVTKNLHDSLKSHSLSHKELVKRLHTAELGCDANHRLAKAIAKWADDLLDLLRDAASEYQDKHHWEQVWHDRAEDMRMERDRLESELSEQKSCAEGFAPPEWYEERVLNMEKERDELRKSLQKIAKRAGLPHSSNLDEYSDDLVAKATLAAIDDAHKYIGALEWQRDKLQAKLDAIREALDG